MNFGINLDLFNIFFNLISDDFILSTINRICFLQILLITNDYLQTYQSETIISFFASFKNPS